MSGKAYINTIKKCHWNPIGLKFFYRVRSESDKLQRCTMEISKLIEKEVSQTLKQACIKDYFA